MLHCVSGGIVTVRKYILRKMFPLGRKSAMGRTDIWGASGALDVYTVVLLFSMLMNMLLDLHPPTLDAFSELLRCRGANSYVASNTIRSFRNTCETWPGSFRYELAGVAKLRFGILM